MRLSWLLVFCLVTTVSYAQTEVTGIIIDAVTRQPVPYVSIGIVGTSRGASSNVDGKFQLFMNSPGDLKFSCVGYESQVLKSPAGYYEVYLRPSVTQLKELIVMGESMDPRRLVAKAFKNVKRNFNMNTFQQTYFYRHYCKDDSVYRRIIEASVKVEKHKGYRMRRQHAGEKEEFKVPQLRRSFDKSMVSDAGHSPFSLKVILESDHVGYQTRKKQGLIGILGNVNGLYYNLRKYTFTLDAITTYDDREVYKINYFLSDTSGLGQAIKYHNYGTLYLTTDTYAIVRSENRVLFFNDTTHSIVSYRKYNEKYYPYHLLREGTNSGQGNRFKHRYHIELMSTGVSDENFVAIKGNEPDRESLAAIPYDSAFWATYTILKKTPLEERIVTDLGGEHTLQQEYAAYQRLEFTRLATILGNERDFNALREEMRGKRLVYLDFWASWCGPCLQELPFEKHLVNRFGRDVTFIMLSIDKNEADWNRALDQYRLRIPGLAHFWIGGESDAVKFYDVTAIPRYILIAKDGNHIALDALRPSDPDLILQLEELLKAP